MLLSSSPTWAKFRSWPIDAQLGINVICPFQHIFYGSEGMQYEVNTAINVAKYILEGDYGWGHIHWQGLNKKLNTWSHYTNDGAYFRLGLNYNFLQDTPDKNIAFLGFRHVWSYFKDHLSSTVVYDSNGLCKRTDNLIDSKQDKVKARWFEVTAGLKVKVWRLLYLGSTLSYKFGLHLDGAHTHIPYDIIGWGLNTNETSFRLNIYLALRILTVRKVT